MTTYRILTLNAISPQGLHRFPSSRYTVGKSVDRPDAIVCRSADLHAIDIPASVKAIGRAGAGTNNIPVAKLSERGVPVFNAPGANANAVKELVLAALLLSARNLVPALAYVAKLDRNASDLEARVEEGKKQFAGVELPGKTLGIIGLGGIGAETARIAKGMGMKVIAYNRTKRSEAPVQLVDLDELLAASDVVSINLVLNDETRNFLNAERIARLKPGAILVNTARGALVEEEAMLDALRSGHIRHAGLDVFHNEPLKADHPLTRMENVTLSAHAAFRTREASETLLRRAIDIVKGL